MDKNRTEGTKHEIKGAIKEVAGKVTGNKAREVAGNVEKNVGKMQNEVGEGVGSRARQKQKTLNTFRSERKGRSCPDRPSRACLSTLGRN